VRTSKQKRSLRNVKATDKPGFNYNHRRNRKISAMKWITREKVKVDRVACPWLIKKFVDPQAEFLFVPANQVEAKAKELGATPFDIDGCELGHHGEDVSFDSILKKYQLDDPALGLLAEIVRAADSHPSKPHPAGEGLRWVAFGFNALGLSDHNILAKEFIVYDALYAECQRQAKTKQGGA
jgi:hypothetical protein